MESNSKPITYKRKMTGQEFWRYVKAIGFSSGLFIIAMVVLSQFARFGSVVLAPLVAAMWVFGVVCAILIPSQKQSILNETHITIAIYLVTLIAVKTLIKLISGVSSEMMMSSFNQAIPLTGGSTITGYLQTLMWITTVMTPLGFIGMQAKKVFTFRKKANKNKELERLRGFRQNNHEHFDG